MLADMSHAISGLRIIKVSLTPIVPMYSKIPRLLFILFNYFYLKTLYVALSWIVQLQYCTSRFVSRHCDTFALIH